MCNKKVKNLNINFYFYADFIYTLYSIQRKRTCVVSCDFAQGVWLTSCTSVLLRLFMERCIILTIVKPVFSYYTISYGHICGDMLYHVNTRESSMAEFAMCLTANNLLQCKTNEIQLIAHKSSYLEYSIETYF